MDVLDLHSNKITKIENISHLADLRVLNLANNLITSVENLAGLNSLTEINLRRNLIEYAHGLNQCPKLQRVFLSSNKIERFENIRLLEEIPCLLDLALDGNPISKDICKYYKTIIEKCSNLKTIDLNKVTPEFKTAALSGKIELILPFLAQVSPLKKDGNSMDKNTGLKDNHFTDQDIGENRMKSDNIDISKNSESKNEITKGPHMRTLNISQNANEIPREKLISIIASEWQNEVARLKMKIFSNQKGNTIESKTESHSGHAEMENNSILYIFGNAMEILDNPEYFNNIEEISFQYLRFDSITSLQNLNILRKYNKLRSIILSHNFIHSFFQVSKLESLRNLNSLTISNNDITRIRLFRPFVLYRFNSLTTFCGTEIKEEERKKAGKFFQNFDKILIAPNIITIVL